MAARDNARETDGVPRGSDGWLFLRATIDSINSFYEYLSSEIDWREFNYGQTRVLTRAEAEQVRKLARAHYAIDMNSPQIRAFMRHETNVEPICIIDEARVGQNSISFLVRDTGEEIIVIAGKKRQEVVRKLLYNAGTCDIAELRRIAFENRPPRPKTKVSEAPTLTTELDSLRKRWQQRGVVIDAYFSGGNIDLSRIVVPKQSRGEGLGTLAMTDLVTLADKYGIQMTLSPSTDFGGSSVARLKSFYKRFGFVENKGRQKDFTISATMYRPPHSR